MREERIGFGLYAITEDPICVDFLRVDVSAYPKVEQEMEEGGCMALRWARQRWYVVILYVVAPNDASGARTPMSISRKYVCDVTEYVYEKPDISVTSRSTSCIHHSKVKVYYLPRRRWRTLS
jgi:hypothetical protein